MLSMKSPSYQTTLLVVVGTALFWWQRKLYKARLEQTTRDWQQKRQEERTGRIRAETKLRSHIKQAQQLAALRTIQGREADESNKVNKKSKTKSSTTTTMLLTSIGTIVSPYTKRMGTPRQPQLVPNSRGYIQFVCQPALLDGITDYNSLWIIFEFHANTNTTATQKAKIRPPRAPNKVGQLATRSPHRPNCLGLSMVTIQHWDATTKRLHVSGLDLVQGTPVYDIKPVVPWDVPNRPLRVPEWVSQDDALSSVEWKDAARQQLNDAVERGLLDPLYSIHNNGVEGARATIGEILAQDPRSSKSTMRYSMVFGRLSVQFVVERGVVSVTSVQPVEFDDSQYVDGIPLINK